MRSGIWFVATTKLEAWFVLLSFFLQRLFCISVNLPYNLAWNVFVTSEQMHRTLGSSLAVSLQPLVHHSNAASLSFFRRYYLGRYSSELAELIPFLYSHGRPTCYSDRLYNISVTIPWCYEDYWMLESFFSRTARLWNSLPIMCFPLIYNLKMASSLELAGIFYPQVLYKQLPVCFSSSFLLFLANPCLVVVAQLCLEWIPFKKKYSKMTSSAGF